MAHAAVHAGRLLLWLSLAACSGLARPVLLAGEDCPADMPYAFALDAEGARDGDGGRVLEVSLVPGQTLSFEVTVYLENLTGREIETSTSSLFVVCVAHDDLLTLEEVTFDGTDYDPLHGFEFLKRAVADDASGFIAADPEDFGFPVSFTLGERMSLVRARYALASPLAPEAMGETVVASVRFQDGMRQEDHPLLPPSSNIAKLPDGRIRTPCLRDLEVRILVEAESAFVRGDATFDGKVDVSDAVSILRTLFEFGDAPIGCEDAADADDDGAVTLSDCVSVFGYLFQGGAPPAPPFPDPGVDPTPDPRACTADT